VGIAATTCTSRRFSLIANALFFATSGFPSPSATENFHVFAISQVGNIEFSLDQQVVKAILRDSHRHQAILKFPYTSRSTEGTEALLEHLANRQLLFVAGQIYLSAEGLIITPVSLVFLSGDRTILQPFPPPT